MAASFGIPTHMVNGGANAGNYSSSLVSVFTDSFRAFTDFAGAMARAITEWADAIRAFTAQHGPLLERLLEEAQQREPDLSSPAEPVTLDELRRLLGGDGAAMPGARFDGEGGFALN